MISFAPLEPDAAAFLSEHTGLDFSAADFTDPRWFCLTCRRSGGALQMVGVGEFKQWFNCHLTMAVEDISCVSPRMLMTVFSTIFSQARRITVIVPPDNQRSLKQLHLLGFVYEGFIRRGFDGTRDALLFGMLPEDSIWLARARRRATRRAKSRTPIIIGGDHGLTA